MRGYLIFNGKNLLDFNAFISGEGTYNAPSRDYTREEIPGRNGSLLIDNGRYEDVELTYPAYITDDFHRNIRALRDFLLSVKGYARLEDTYHPDVFYMAAVAEGITVSTSGRYNTEGQFNITFLRKPQRFLKSGEKTHTFTADGEIYNPTLFEAKPLIRIYGTGTVGIGAVNVTYDGSSAYFDINSDIQDAYYNGVNKNSSVTLSPNRFPTLPTGTTGITLGSGITKVEITPNWWHL